jgi:hypothetical protein
MKYFLCIMFGAALMFGYAWKATAQDDEIKVCTDRTTYPPVIVIVAKGTQCPAGYY